MRKAAKKKSTRESDEGLNKNLKCGVPVGRCELRGAAARPRGVPHRASPSLPQRPRATMPSEAEAEAEAAAAVELLQAGGGIGARARARGRGRGRGCAPIGRWDARGCTRGRALLTPSSTLSPSLPASYASYRPHPHAHLCVLVRACR